MFNAKGKEMKEISSAFVKAQKAFGPALKTSTNPHFRSKYADLSACVEAVIDALNDNGIAVMQRNLPDADGVAVETVFIHESGEQLTSGVLRVPASKQDPQGYGSALTYARRYSLMAACGIAPEDDDGNQASAFNRQQPTKATPAKATSAEMDMSPKGRADRITQGVENGDAANAALAMSGWNETLRLSVWDLLSTEVQQELNKVWPK